jgi:BNR repeat-containing family member
MRSARRFGRPLVRALVLVGAVVAIGLVVRDATDESTRLEAPPPQQVDLRNGRVFTHDNLWTHGDEQYAVWTAPDGTPYVGRRQRGGDRWVTVNLARVPGNPLGAPTEDDLHNVYAVAVDAEGFVHVAGNMHNDAVRYIRSVRPGDLSEWTAVGLPGPSAKVTYPTFVRLVDGSLLFFHREGITGDGSVVLHALPAGEDEWRSRGVLLAGQPTEESPYLHEAVVDPATGTVHVMFSWRIKGLEGGIETTNDLGYARSTDSGRTWETSEGRPLSTPISHPAAETILETPDTGSGMRNNGGMTLDAEGRPHGVVLLEHGPGVRGYTHVWLDATGWHRQRVPPAIDARPAIAGSRDGGVWLLGSRGGTIVAVELTRGDLEERRVGAARRSWEVSFDAMAWRDHGTVEMLVPSGREPHVLVADLS